MCRILFACLSILFSNAAVAGEAEKALVDSWYKALAVTDRAGMSALLADEAKITLGDLDIQQTKVEFIDSLDEWEGAMKGSTLRHVVEKDEAGLVTAIVCYSFSDNESMTREVFGFSAGRIVSSEQETVSDSCAEFPK